ncbi:HD family phosphohydrolase [Caldalkalibacillus mannanilyticus]|uniref:HD family phosphohydrolase n=1 Tax=Caldalkalibacillus mannanilyticus TaxID=1418 RepID=UPI000468B597|nr:HD family phosphohydrolase [Caldalkalibacillus mannanilyticus]
MRRKLALDERSKLWNKFKEHPLLRLFLYITLGIVLYLFMVGNITPEIVEVTEGSKAEKDIVSPITIVDEHATKIAKDRAAREVKPIYTKEDTITKNQLDKLDKAFQKIMEINNSVELSEEERIQRLDEITTYKFNEAAYEVFLTYSPEEIETLRRITKSIVQEILENGVSDRNNGIQEATQQVNDSLVLSSLDNKLRIISREMAIASIVPNFLINQEDTELARENAREKVRNIEIREGEIIVAEGETITGEAYRKIRLVGLLSESANLRPLFGLALLIGLILLFLYFYISFSDLPIRKNNTQFLMYMMIFVLNVIVMKIISVGQTLEYAGFGFLAPVAFATMLITMLIHQRLAIFSSFIFGIIAAVLLNGESTSHMDFTYGLATIFSGAAGAFFLGKATRKTKILQAGFVISIVMMMAILTVTLLKNTPVGWFELSQFLLYGFLNGLLASVLTIGLLPFFEAAFGILSSMKLIELSNPNNPLLRKLLIEAPGTYHHSIMVANLAEAATEAVGGNGLLARVGAYYHDVGKTKRPHFFIENQMNMGNPHDKIAPQLSKTIITAHAKDGADMLREYGLPKAIQDIAEQHHGTTLLKYFYLKAKEESESEIAESDFRYPGPKAQFKESAIVGIADCIEAAVRSLSKPSPERIENMVRNIIRDRLDDGQFNECDLTLKELDIIAKVICQTLHGIFHSRIEYPEDKEKAKSKEKETEKEKAPASNQAPVDKSEANQSIPKVESQ